MLDRIEIRPTTRSNGATVAPLALADLDREVRTACAEFPTIAIAIAAKPGGARLVVDAEAWRRDEYDLHRLDASVDELISAGSAAVGLSGASDVLADQALALLTRCQRWLERTNDASKSLQFCRILSGHRQLFDLAKPLVLADYRHALDVWQWVLRLDPLAGIAVQIAALFHDVERLVSEADRRIEQHAADYQSFKNAHAAHGARLASEVLSALGTPSTVVERVAELVARHEARERDPDLALLADADALSFFSLNSNGFVEYYGPAHTERKVLYTLARLRPMHLWRLTTLRLHRDVRAIVERETAP